MCITLVSIVFEFLEGKGLKLKATSLLDDSNLLQAAQNLQMSVGGQPKRVPPVVADSCGIGVFLAESLEAIPCALMSKLPKDIILFTKKIPASHRSTA